MGKSHKVKNLCHERGVPIKSMVFSNIDSDLRIIPVLYGSFYGKPCQVGTWQLIKKDNILVQDELGKGEYKVFRITDNKGSRVEIENKPLLESILSIDSVEDFFNKTSPFINVNENRWIVNINKKKKFDEFEKMYGIKVTLDMYLIPKKCLVLDPIEVNEGDDISEISKGGDKIYISMGDGFSKKVDDLHETVESLFEEGVCIIIVGERCLRVYLTK